MSLRPSAVRTAALAWNIGTAQANLQAGARHFSLGDLQTILILTADFDQRLRQFRTEHYGLLLELYLYYVIVKKGRATEAPDFGWPAFQGTS